MEFEKKIPFKIFPSIGFKNSSFQLHAFQNNITLELFKENEKINTFYPKTNNPIIITELKEPGDYIAKCFINGEIFSQTLKVEDLLRWGSSTFKKAFVFDNIDYSFYLMKDRMFIYDEIKKTTYLENKLSPSEICKIDNKHLLFITHKGIGKDKRTNFAIFSLESFSIISELVDNFIEIYYDEKSNFLLVFEKKSNSIKCFDFNKNLKLIPILTYENILSYVKNDSKNYLLIKQLENVVFVNCNTNKSFIYPLNDNTLIDNNGNLLEKNDSNFYLSNPIQGKDKKKVDITLNLNIEENLNYLFHIGNSFKSNDEDNDFEERVQRIVNNHNECISSNISYQKFYLNNSDDKISIENTKHEIIFMRNKIMIFEIHSIKKLLHIKYNIVNGDISKKPDFTIINTYKLIDLLNPNNNFIRNNYCTGIELLNEDFLIIRYFGKCEIFCDGDLLEIPNNVIKTKVIDLPILNKSYLLINKDKEFQLFSSNDTSKYLIQGKSIYNTPYISKHKTIWYSNSENDKITGFSLLNEKNISFNGNHFSIYNFHEYYFINSIKQIFDPSTGTLKNTLIGNLVSFSNSFEKIISRRNEDLYLTIINLSNNLVSTHEIKIEEDLYKESYLSPDGKFMIFRRKDNSYVIYDVQKETEQVFICDNFIRFNSNNQIEVANSEPRNIKIIDPETFETISYGQSDLYEFQSPDGKLFVESRTPKKLYINLLDNLEIDQITFLKLEKLINENNESFFNQNKDKLLQIGVENNSSIFKNRHKIISYRQFIKIGIVGTDVKIDIEIPNNTWFYNYAAFSFDNQYLSIVGNTTSSSSNGMILIIKINFDNTKNLISEEDRFLSYLPKNATWTCAFSRKGVFATYDSNPDTYIINCNDNLFNKTSQLHSMKDYDLRNLLINFYKIENVALIRDKNFLTFSPSGNYMALSEQPYDPLSLGGFGHQESETVHILNVKNNKIIDSFYFHGEVIDSNNRKKVKFVSFSEDETKLLSLGNDGVIYFRNLKLN
jgi:hypothetical protein